MVHLAYNGIDTDLFRPAGFRADLPWPEPRLVIGVACALRPEKGLFTLLDAFARLRRGYPAARLLIVGSGPVEGALRNRAADLALGVALPL